MRTLIVTAAAALLVAGTAFAQTSSGGTSGSSPGMSSGSSSGTTGGTSSSGSTHRYKKNPQQSQVPSHRSGSSMHGTTTTKPGNGNSMSNSPSDTTGSGTSGGAMSPRTRSGQ